MTKRLPYEYYDQIPPYPTKQTRYQDTINSAERNQEPVPSVLTGANYSQGWLIRQIGKYIKVEFLIGTNMLIDREGVLKEVGVNYIVLKESGTNDDLMCDMYSIKFVRVFDDQRKALIC